MAQSSGTKHARIRHVFPTTEIAHLWASGKVADARNPQDNFRFGPSRMLTSYSTDIARIVTRKGKDAALFYLREDYIGENDKDWSHTTNGQMWTARHAARHLPRFSVADLGTGWRTGGLPNHKANLRAYDIRIAYCNEKALRAIARGGDWSFDADAVEAEARDYCAFFGLSARNIPSKKVAREMSAYFAKQKVARAAERVREKAREAQRAADHAAWLADAPAREAAEAARQAAWLADAPAREAREAARQEQARIERAEREAKAAKRAAEMPLRMLAWRAGEYVSDAYEFPETLLRVSPVNNYAGMQIETSLGARVPYDAARRLYLAWLRKEARHGDSIGHYTVLKVNGDITIGCHHITRAEADRLAASEGWAVVPAMVAAE